MEKKTSVLSNSLIWFGAGVSIAEILTGTLIAPLGFGKGLPAIFLGHAVGCLLMYFAGLIGGQTGKSAMETVKISFGQKGSLLFSSLNVLQLVGWTAVMIVSAAAAAGSIADLGGGWIWSLVIGALVALWVLVGIKNLGKLNVAVMCALFVLTVVLCAVVFRGGAAPGDGSVSFGGALELSVAMPLSWLPLISDYTRTARQPKAAAAASCATYFAVSCWMYVIGMGAALYTGGSDVAVIMLRAGLGVAGLLIVVFSTVTTTFLDVYSAGVSSESISSKLREKPAALAVCALGTLLAIFTPAEQFENFLYLIGSVFAPMTAILIVDYFILKKDSTGKKADWVNLVLWAVGFAVYRVFLGIDTPVGNTVPAIIITGLLSLGVNKILIGGVKNAR